MLHFDKLSMDEQLQVQRACAFLFSPEDSKNIDFLKTIDVKSVKTAFRRKAKMYHPDLNTGENSVMIERRKERFIKIRDSYESLVSALPQEPKPVIWDVKKRKAKIIAVGGAKGGIGKSLFAVNMAVSLSKSGYKTIIADFDLGGANLHLYLGLTRINKSINDFLNKKVEKIEDVFIKTDYGPILISGNSSSLGAANIHFSKKMRLINSIQNLDADYVIVDLGGDTSYNMLDFFNAADLNIVMTTCEPASYLDAYNFIKVAFLRRLTRHYNSDKQLGQESCSKLNTIINNYINENNGPVSKLMQVVKAEQPDAVNAFDKIIESYKPLLLINKADGTSAPYEVSRRIMAVAERMLSVCVETAKPIVFDKKIEESARELIPVITGHPESFLNDYLSEFLKKYII